MPTTCARESADCGPIADRCGGELDCGACQSGVCGELIPNVCGCPPEDQSFASAPRTARAARSAGFAGTDEEYTELYDETCDTVDDCVESCLAQGGEPLMCEASECLTDMGAGGECLPAPVWSNLQGIEGESDSVDGAVQLVVVFSPYRDTLLASELGLEIPDAAVVRGITVEVRRAGDASVSDGSVRLARSGELVGAERAVSAAWSEELGWVTYGGSSDLWGETWSPADLRADDFGVGVSVAYDSSVGNARAYVDQVRVTVHYSLVCDD